MKTKTAKKKKGRGSWDNLLVPDSAKPVLDDLRKVALVDDVPPPLPPVVFGDVLELKRVKVAAAQSQETTAYTADIHFKGVRVASVRNDGGGGEDMVSYASREAREKVEDWLRTLPPMSGNRFDLEGLQAAEEAERRSYHMGFPPSKAGLEDLAGILLRRHQQFAGRGAEQLAFLVGGGYDAGFYRIAVKLTPQVVGEYRVKGVTVVPFADFAAVPAHYYPSPHAFFASSWAEHVPTGLKGRVAYSTTDEAVEIELEDRHLVKAAPDVFAQCEPVPPKVRRHFLVTGHLEGDDEDITLYIVSESPEQASAGFEKRLRDENQDEDESLSYHETLVAEISGRPLLMVVNGEDVEVTEINV